MTLEVSTVPIDSVREDPDNARLHDRRNLETIAASLGEFGQVKPIVVRRGIVVAGNGTLVAARDLLGWGEIDITEPDLSDAQAKAYAILDNRTSDLSEFDDAALALAIESLAEYGVDFDLGFSDDEVEALLDKVARSSTAGTTGGEATGGGGGESGETGIAFSFGDVRGLVAQETYEDFVRIANERRPEFPTLSAILASLFEDAG